MVANRFLYMELRSELRIFAISMIAKKLTGTCKSFLEGKRTKNKPTKYICTVPKQSLIFIIHKRPQTLYIGTK